MEPFISDLQRYLGEVTGLKVSIRAADIGDLPLYLTQRYALYRLTVAGTTLLAVCLRPDHEFKPVQFKKDLRQFTAEDMDSVCVIAETLASYVRKRMIEQGIPFVVPGVQMYLPQLGLAMRARAGKKRSTQVDSLSPATQSLLICWLIGYLKLPATPLSLAASLNYSTMTMSRALSELAAVNIGEVVRKGRERLLNIETERRDIWQDALPLMRNPVTRVRRIRIADLEQVDLLPAGLSALAQRTMLGEPETPEYAVSSGVWQHLESKKIETIPIEEPGTCMLQIWRYDPFPLQTDGMVDPFSLFLSLQEDKDERIEYALEEMMDQVKW